MEKHKHTLRKIRNSQWIKHLILLPLMILALHSGYAQTEVWVANYSSLDKIDVNGKKVENNLYPDPVGESSNTQLVTYGTKLIGATFSGGAKGGGTIFAFDMSTKTFEVLYNLSYATELLVGSNMLVTSNGILVGATTYGGSPSYFTLNLKTKQFNRFGSTKTQFGEYGVISGAMCEASNGKVYALKSKEGEYGMGAIIEIDPTTRATSTAYLLTKDDGEPSGGFTKGAGNLLYFGTKNIRYSSGGNTYTKGNLCSFDPSSKKVTTLYSFGKYEDCIGTPFYANNGKIYGYTAWGGYTRGTMYEFDPAKKEITKTVAFGPTTYGFCWEPHGQPIQGLDGKIYGLTDYGGSSYYNNKGSFFEYDVKDNSIKNIIYYDNSSTNLTTPTLANNCPTGNCAPTLEQKNIALQNDSLFLVKLYNATNGKNWINNQGWLKGPIGNWNGVKVSDVDGVQRVTELKLSSNNMVGSLPDNISTDENFVGLNKLQILTLSSNKLTGKIPDDFLSRFKMLTSVNLSNNDLTGDVPLAIFELTQLKGIYLHENRLSSFNGDWRKLENAEIIYVNENAFTTIDLSNLPPKCALFSLANNNISDITYNFPTDKHSNFLWLDLTGNKLSKSNFTTLTSRFPNTYISGIKQRNALQKPNGTPSVSEDLLVFEVENVASDNYVWNSNYNGRYYSDMKTTEPKLSVESAQDYMKCYAQYKINPKVSYSYLLKHFDIVPLTKAYIRPNFIDSMALVNIYTITNGKDWKNNSNWLTGPVVTWHGIELDNTGNISSIDLSNNGLAGSLNSNYSVGFLHPFGKVKKFNISNNKITGEVPASLIKLFTSLEELKINNNTLSGAIPNEVTQLTNLKIIDASYCNITEMPSNLSQLSNLEQVKLASNAITAFPQSLLSLATLKELNLSKNKIATIGQLPSAIASNKISINLDYNLLTHTEYQKLAAKVRAPSQLNCERQILPIIEQAVDNKDRFTLTVTSPSQLINKYRWYEGWDGYNYNETSNPQYEYKDFAASSNLRAKVIYWQSTSTKTEWNFYGAEQRFILKVVPDFAPDLAITTKEDYRSTISLASIVGNSWLTNLNTAGIGSVSDAKITISKTPTHGSVSTSTGMMYYYPTKNYNGTDEFEYTITSTKNASIKNTGKVSITVTPVNDAPVIVLNQTSFMVEYGKSVNIPVSANDDADAPDQSELTITIQGNSNGTSTYDKAKGYITFTPTVNLNTSAYLFVSAQETQTGGLRSSSRYVYVQIKQTGNTAPIARNISGTARMNGYAVLYPNVSDKETSTNALKNYITSPYPQHGRTYKSGNAFIYYPYYNYSGNDRFGYYTRDEGGLNSATAQANITVLGDQPPVIRNYYKYVDVGRDGYAKFSLSELAYDDNTYYSNMRYYFNYYNGSYYNAYASRYFTINRTNIRHCYTYYYGWWSRYRYTYCYSYPGYDVEVRATRRTIDTYRYYARYYRSFGIRYGSIPYTVYDNRGQKSTGWISPSMTSWTKSATMVDDKNIPPIFTYNDTVSVKYNQPDTIYFEAIGQPGTTVTIEMVTAPKHGSLTNFSKAASDFSTLYTGIYTATTNAITLDSCQLKVSDNEGNTVNYWNYFNISGASQAPVIADIPTQNGYENKPMNIEIPVTDADDDLESLNVQFQLIIGDTNFVANKAILDGKMYLNFTPPTDFVDSAICIVTIMDKDAQMAQKQFFIYIEPENTAPAIATNEDSYTINAGQALEIFAFTIDPDREDSAKLNIIEKPDWIIVSESNFNFIHVNATPTVENTGNYTITLEANDGHSVVYKTIDIVVLNPNDQAPIVQTPIDDVVLAKNVTTKQIDISNVFIDPDGDKVYVEIEGNTNPTWINATITDGKLNIKVKDNKQLGLAQITLVGLSNGKSANTSFFIETPDKAPVANYSIDDVETERNTTSKTVSIAGLFTDPDGDAMNINVSGNSFTKLVTPIISGNNLKLNFNGTGGESYLTITAEAYGKTANVTFRVKVKDIAPEVASPLNDTVIYKNQSPLSLDLSNVFVDLDDVQLEKSVSSISDSSLITEAQLFGDQANISFAKNKSGTVSVTFKALSNTQSVDDEVTITILDRAPVVTRLFDRVYAKKTDAPTSIILSDYFIDPDGEPLTYEVKNNSNPAIVDPFIEDGVLYLQYLDEEQGLAGIQITATADGKSVSSTLSLSLGFGVGTKNVSEDLNVLAYPNPSNIGGWTITLGDKLNSSSMSYTLYSLNGKTLLTGILTSGEFIKAQNISKGYYLLKIMHDDVQVTIPVSIK